MKYGVSYGSLMNPSNPLGSTALQTAAMSDVKRLGCAWIRIEFSWSRIQPVSSSAWDWSVYDPIVTMAKSLGLNVLGEFNYCPAWACSVQPGPPTSNTQFAAYCAATVARYATGGTFGSAVNTWEVWNEPDLTSNWVGGASPSAYTTMFNAAAIAIHGAASAQTVLMGSLAGGGAATVADPVTWMTAFNAGSGFANADAIGLHPYTYPRLASTTKTLSGYNWYNQLGSTSSVVTIMAANGKSAMPIWITEYGAPTYGFANDQAQSDTVGGAMSRMAWPGCVTETYQGQLITDGVAQAKLVPQVSAFFLDTGSDRGLDPTNQQHWFGVRRYDGTPTPGWQAYATAVATG